MTINSTKYKKQPGHDTTVIYLHLDNTNKKKYTHKNAY